MDARKRQPIGVELVKRGIVKERDIEMALQYQRQDPSKKLGDILYRLQVCDPKTLIEGIGDIIGEKGIVLTKDNLKVRLTDYFSLDVAQKNKVIPFEVVSGKIKVCFANTVDQKNMNTIKLLLLNKGLVMDTYITFESDIDRILKSMEGEVTTDFSVSTGSNDTAIGLVDSIIKTGIERRASDIHIEPMADQIRIRYRIDGVLFTAAKIKKEKQQQIIRKIKSHIQYASRKTRSTGRKNFSL